MTIVYFTLLILIIFGLLAIGYVSIFNNFQSLIIRLNEAENFINTTLRKRYDLLNKALSVVKPNKKSKEEVLPIISNLKSKKLNNFELDRKLYDAINEFTSYKKEHEELSNDDTILKIDLGLFESEAEIVAARKYYNDIVTDYNKLLKSFPSNIIGKICRYKSKAYFDGNNINEENKIKI